MRISILGLALTSAWGNGHATTYRSLCQALHARGHTIRFLEKDVSWYRDHRDLPDPPFCTVTLYEEWIETRSWMEETIAQSDLVIIGSYFPDGLAAAHELFARAQCPVFFYDIDTPVTLQRLRTHGETEALCVADVPRYDAYLSFTGGPVLQQLEQQFGARRAMPLFCSVDREAHQPQAVAEEFGCTLSYLGTYSGDRQAKLEELLLAPAEVMRAHRFVVAGAQYPESTAWPTNVRRFEHVPPPEHASFYSSSAWTLNLTRESMVTAGWSPSVRLFEAAACGAAILSDSWPGLDQLLTPGREVMVVHSRQDVFAALSEMTDKDRVAMGEAARLRVLAEHTSEHRARELEEIVQGVLSGTGRA